MPRGVCCEAVMQASSFGYPSNNLVPSVSGTSLCRVPIRLGAKQPPSADISISPFVHVDLEQLSSDIAIHHDTSPPVLCRLRSNGHLLQRKRDISYLKGNQLTSSECSVVGEE